MDSVEWLFTLAIEDGDIATFAALSRAVIDGAQTVKGDTAAARKLDMRAALEGKGFPEWRSYISKLGEFLGQEIVAASVEACAVKCLEESVGRALAEARRNPKGLAKSIEPRLAKYEGDAYVAQGRRIVTKEGTAAVKDALSYLRSHQPLQPVLPFGEGLRLAAEDHADDIGRNGLVSHTGSDGSSSSERMQRYGRWTGACGECLWYGRIIGRTGLGVIEDLVIDDGVASRGHRHCIFDDRYNVAGVKLLPHEIYGHVVVIEFAGAYEDDKVAIQKRTREGPPVHEVKPGSSNGRTQWKLGCCGGCSKEIKGGSVVEACGMKWHKDCFACTKCSTQLSGVPFMTEAKKLYCNSCHTSLFGKECAYCNKKIEGRVLTTQGKTWHEECFKKHQEAEAKPTVDAGKTVAAAAAAAVHVVVPARSVKKGAAPAPAARRRAPVVAAATKPTAKRASRPTSLAAAGATLSKLGMDYGDL